MYLLKIIYCFLIYSIKFSNNIVINDDIIIDNPSITQEYNNIDNKIPNDNGHNNNEKSLNINEKLKENNDDFFMESKNLSNNFVNKSYEYNMNLSVDNKNNGNSNSTVNPNIKKYSPIQLPLSIKILSFFTIANGIMIIFFLIDWVVNDNNCNLSFIKFIENINFFENIHVYIYTSNSNNKDDQENISLDNNKVYIKNTFLLGCILYLIFLSLIWIIVFKYIIITLKEIFVLIFIKILLIIIHYGGPFYFIYFKKNQTVINIYKIYGQFFWLLFIIQIINLIIYRFCYYNKKNQDNNSKTNINNIIENNTTEKNIIKENLNQANKD